MKIKFLRVLGTNAKVLKPGIVVIVDDQLVKWNGGLWTTHCACPEDETCPHLDAVLDLLDDRVLGDAR